jgi:cell wall-associated NlpC family hydrolase
VTGQTATGGSVRSRRRDRPGGATAGWTPIFVLVVALAAGLLLAVGPASADPSVDSKKEQAQAILAELDQLDTDLAQSNESYNFDNGELDRLDGELELNGRHLVAARKSLNVAQRRIAERLRDLYVNGEGDSTLEVILGAQSLDDIIARLDAISRVSSQDARILRTVKRYRAEVETRRAKLKDARVDQAQIVSERAAQKASIESRLAERQQLYESVKDEIAELQAAERQRQAMLIAQARERLAAQQAAVAAQASADTYSNSAPDVSVETPSYVPPPDGSKASQVVAIAMQYLGVPYVWGGSSPSQGFDCSGLVSYVYAQIGISLPHHAASQYKYGTPVPYGAWEPGDLVFFSGLGHMGMYIGGGQFIHAPHTGDVVRITSMSERMGSYVGARRIL